MTCSRSVELSIRSRFLDCTIASCARCACDDVAAELDFCDRMEARRCAVRGCGSGLGVPVQVGRDAALRCVHCGDTWGTDEDDESDAADIGDARY